MREWSVTPDEWLIDGREGSVGEKRQRCLEKAAGDIIVQMDDDDIQHPRRLEKQVKALSCDSKWPRYQTRLWGLVGTNTFLVRDECSGRTVKSKTWGSANGVFPAGSMAYWRDLALVIGWQNGTGAEIPFCHRWAELFRGLGRSLHDMSDPDLFVHVRHGGNVSPDDWCWTEDDASPKSFGW
jgi:glycosyltransferase involved in cell wall biosynthesis